MRLLSFERRWLRVVFEAIYPADAHPALPLGARDAPVDALLTEFEQCAPFDAGAGLRAAAWLVWFAPVVLAPFRTFGGLDPAARAEVLDRLGRSPFYVLREVPMLLKMVGGFAYGALPDVQRALGLPDPATSLPAWARDHGTGGSR